MTQRFFRLCLSGTAAAALISPSLGIAPLPFAQNSAQHSAQYFAGFGVPVAHAETCDQTHRNVESGSLEWGVKESFRSYITGNIARGSITTDGGASGSSNGFSFPAASSAVGGQGNGTVSFDGSVRFYGHEGKLDITLSNLSLAINGSSAELSADYVAYEYTGMDAAGRGPKQEGKGVTFARVQLDSPADFSADHVSLSGAVTLTDAGVTVFGGFYESGTQLDNLGGSLSLTNACGPAPDGNSGGSKPSSPDSFVGPTDSGATDGVAGLLGDVNDSLVEVNGLVVNSGYIMQNADLLARIARGDAAAAATVARASGASPQPSQGSRAAAPAGASGTTGASPAPHTASAASAGAGAARPASGATQNAAAHSATAKGGAAHAGTAGANPTCDASADRGVESATARWGVRTSFRNYLRGSIAKGGWNLQGVGFNGSEFEFAGNSGAVKPQEKSGTIHYPGTLQFYGHNGVLDTRLSDLEIRFAGDSGQLMATVKANDTSGNSKDVGRVALANLAFNSLTADDSSVYGSARLTLTQEGAEAFGGFYPAGDPLDDLTFSAQLGGSAECSSAGAGGNASRASHTGHLSGAFGGTGGSAAGSAGFGASFGGDSSSPASQDNKFRINSAKLNDSSFFDANTALTMLIILGAFVLGSFTRTRLSRSSES